MDRTDCCSGVIDSTASNSLLDIVSALAARALPVAPGAYRCSISRSISAP
jgi:hypothetical protein